PDKQPEQPPEKEKEKEPDKKTVEQPPIDKTRPPRNFAFSNTFPELRVEVVCGLYHFNQACTDLAIVIDIMEKEMVKSILRDRGDYLYPVGGRIHNPALFTTQLIDVMKKLKITFPDEAAFKKAMEDRLTAKKGKVRDAG